MHNSLRYKHDSRRQIVYAKKGMTATSHPLAAQAGMKMLESGGNAIDAAVAMAAALTVLEPTSNGIGGDAFAIFWKDGKIHGLNASGPAPKSINADILRDKEKLEKMPELGVLPITVPGQISAWDELISKHGKLFMEEVLSPAIEYAEEGAPIAVGVVYDWMSAQKRYPKDGMFKAWHDTFTIDGKAPQAGEDFKLKDHGQTLRAIAKNPRSFYEGDLADKIVETVQKNGGYLEKSDLENFNAEWVEPISANFRDYTVLEIPPNGHGIVALEALSILDQLEDTDDEILYHHQMIEAIKISFADAFKYVTEAKDMKIAPEDMLNKEYIKERAENIGDKAKVYEAGNLPKGGTVYLCAADEEGNMISFIQSNYTGFGSGVVVPGTGIALHNRGANFSLEKGHHNELAGGKRPYHTIIPGFLMKGDRPVGPFGIMGAFMQPQAHVQVLSYILRDLENPQEAIDRPRFQWREDGKIWLEWNFDKEIAEGLEKMGHDIEFRGDFATFGRGQIIFQKENGVYLGATEKRCDGTVIGR